MILRNTFCYIVHLIAAAGAFGATTPGEPFRVSAPALPLLENYCVSCHDADAHKGDVRLDNLASLSLEARLDLLNRVQEQIFLGEMPPKNKKQPTEAERRQLFSWLSAELRIHKASKLEDKLSRPEFGNYVEHEKLFSGEYAKLPGFTTDRRWLISEFIFNAKFQRMLGNVTTQPKKGKGGAGGAVLGGVKIQNLSLINPFLLPSVSGVRYYANEDLTGAHLSSLLTRSPLNKKNSISGCV